MATWLAAGAVSVLAPPLTAVVWRLRFGWLSVATVVRTALVAGALTLGWGWLAAAALRAAGTVPATLVGPTAGGVALVAGLLTAVARAWPDRHPRATMALLIQLRDPDAREAALAALRAQLDRARPRRPDGRGAEAYARAVLLATPDLGRLGDEREVEARLAAVAPQALREATRARWAQALASLRWRLGDEPGTRAAVAVAPRPAPDPRVEAWLVAFDALVSVLDGAPQVALDALGPADEDGDPTSALGVARRIARAHAEADLGRRDAARRILGEVRGAAGDAGLALARRPRGPASPLAGGGPP